MPEVMNEVDLAVVHVLPSFAIFLGLKLKDERKVPPSSRVLPLVGHLNLRRDFIAFAVAAATFVFGGLAGTVDAESNGVETVDAELARLAWEAYEEKDWSAAVKFAEDCIEQFKTKATDTEKHLKDAGIEVPPEGRCTELERLRIEGQQGLVNNVGSCYWVLGRANQKLAHIDAAREAFSMAVELTHAVAYDERIPGYWSVALDAQGRLEDLPAEGDDSLPRHRSNAFVIAGLAIFAVLAVVGVVLAVRGWRFSQKPIQPPETIGLKENSPKFDVFLAHNNIDDKSVGVIAEELKKQGLRTWLACDQIRPGQGFQDKIQEALKNVKSFAIFIGPAGLGKWQTLELNSAISQCVEGKIPVIPVLLPGVAEIPTQLPFLTQFNAVAFKSSPKDKDSIERLVWGITGQHPASDGRNGV